MPSDVGSYYSKQRIKDLSVPASHPLNESLSVTAGMPEIEDALNVYLCVKSIGRSALFHGAAKQNVRYWGTALGVRSLDKYSTNDASKFRESLIEEQKVGTSLSDKSLDPSRPLTTLRSMNWGLRYVIHPPVSTSHHLILTNVTPSVLRTSERYRLSVTNEW